MHWSLSDTQTIVLALFGGAGIIVSATGTFAVQVIKQMGLIRQMWIDTMNQGHAERQAITAAIDSSQADAIVHHTETLAAVDGGLTKLVQVIGPLEEKLHDGRPTARPAPPDAGTS
jgi:hypothetical protein